MKRGFKISAAVMAVIGTLSVCACTHIDKQYSDGTFTYSYANRQDAPFYYVDECDENAVNAVIADEINGYPVTTFGEDDLFYGCTKLESLTIGENVKKVPDYLCCPYEEDESPLSALKSVSIGKSVTTIGQSAFYGCRALSSVSFSASSALEQISHAAFRKCNLTHISLPSSVMSIGAYAFRENQISSFTVPKSVTSLGQGIVSSYVLEELTVEEGNTVYSASGNCIMETATGTVVLGCGKSEMPTDGSVKEIAPYAFCEVCNANSIFVPNSVQKIDKYAFTWELESGEYTFEEIVFGGTMEEWNNVEKEDGWIFCTYLSGTWSYVSKSPSVTITCTDGTIQTKEVVYVSVA